MTTTTPRARAGRPYTPPMPLHRAMPSDFVLQIDVVLPDEELEIRNGFDQAMKAPISKPIAEPAPQVEASKDVRASAFAFWSWGLLMWTVIVFCMGWLSHRFYS